MSIGMVLNTARMALNAQQSGLTVTGHNIANVNSPHYSRQTLNHKPKDPVFYDGLWYGTGVEASSIKRTVDQFLENRLMDYTSDYEASKETSAYMNILETAFNENTENGINTIMSQFWNSWLDLSNNPTGSPERVAVYEKGVHIAERLDTLTNDLARIETDMNNEITAIISSVGTIASQIAELNNSLISQQSGNISLDMMDHRNGLAYDLAELVDINSFEQPDGSLADLAAGGYNLVSGASSLSLTFSGGRVLWEGSVDITDKLTSGKIKGWLEMRDEIVTKYQAEVDALAKEFIWAVNYQHSQGVGKQYSSSAVTGTYATDSSEMLNTLTFGHKIDYTEDFKMWVEDTSGSPSTFTSVTTDMAVSTDNPTYPGGDFFAQNNSTYTITVTGITGSGIVGTDDITFEWTDTVGGGAPVTVNMNGPAVTANIDGMLLTFSAGDVLVAGNTLKINTDDNGGGGDDVAVSLTPSGTANSILDNYKFTVSSVTGDGEVGTDTISIDWSNSNTTGSFTLDSSTTTATVDGMMLTFAAGGWFVAADAFTIETDSTGSPTAYMMSDWHWTLDSFVTQFNADATAAAVGVTASKTSTDNITFTPGANEGIAFGDDQFTDSGLTAALGINTFFDGIDAQTISVNSVLVNKDYIAAAQIDAATGDFGVGDSRNATDIANIQHATRSVAQWTYPRGSDATSSVLNVSMANYYQTIIGTMGIKSAELSLTAEYKYEMMGRMTEQRDNLSAVSLDEEMINLMKYQQAYTMASKLISVGDEMLMTLINTK